MVRGILADADVERQVQVLCQLLQQDYRLDFWTYLNLATPSFADVGLVPRDSDLAVWKKCQEEQLVLITANRNAEEPDSLESVIRALNTPMSLPVITLANQSRLLRDKTYAECTADKLLEYLVEIERYRGTGRLYVS